jgi:hypothetical protein
MRSFELFYQEAHRAGDRAANAAIPTPMVVTQHANPLDDDSVPVKQWHVSEGACGFAWIWFKGNTEFGRWAKKVKGASKGYPNGLQLWVHDYGQSIERKSAYAQAFADVLRSHGIEVFAQSRMD